MEARLKQQVANVLGEYFPGAELPITFFYTNEERWAAEAGKGAADRCVICNLARARDGETLVLDAESTKCGGGKRYLGFSQELQPDFEYFLSCGLPGKMEGERYKKTPQLVKDLLRRMPPLRAPGKYIVFKRWDKVGADEVPLAVTWFAQPDVLSGLYTLANFDSAEDDSVIAPFGAGCSSIVYHPLVESKRSRARAVLGMFDVSARPCVGADRLTFSVPMARLEQMVANAGESFLITHSWKVVRDRIRGGE